MLFLLLVSLCLLSAEAKKSDKKVKNPAFLEGLRKLAKCGNDSECARKVLRQCRYEANIKYNALLLLQGFRAVNRLNARWSKCVKQSSVWDEKMRACVVKGGEEVLVKIKKLRKRRIEKDYISQARQCLKVKGKGKKRCASNLKHEMKTQVKALKVFMRSELSHLHGLKTMEKFRKDFEMVKMAVDASKCTDNDCYAQKLSDCDVQNTYVADAMRCRMFVDSMPLLQTKLSGNGALVSVVKDMAKCRSDKNPSKCRKKVFNKFKAITEDKVAALFRLTLKLARISAKKKLIKCKKAPLCEEGVLRKMEKVEYYDRVAVLTLNARAALRQCKYLKKKDQVKKCKKRVKHEKYRELSFARKRVLDRAAMRSGIMRTNDLAYYVEKKAKLARKVVLTEGDIQYEKEDPKDDDVRVEDEELLANASTTTVATTAAATTTAAPTVTAEPLLVEVEDQPACDMRKVKQASRRLARLQRGLDSCEQGSSCYDNLVSLIDSLASHLEEMKENC